MADALIASQHHLYGLISRASENFRKLKDSQKTKAALNSRIALVQRNWEKFHLNHDALFALKLTEDQLADGYFKDDLFSSAQERFLQEHAELSALLEEIQPAGELVVTAAQTAPSISIQHQHRSLPKINIPRFTGQYQDWTSFRDLFQSIIGNNESLAPVEKLHYLKGCLSGDASRAISEIPVTDEGYQRCWEKLSQRYENKRALITAQMDKLFSLKPVFHEGAPELGFLRSTVNEVLEAMRALGYEVDKWDPMMVYFISRRLDAETQKAWELCLGCSVDPPTFAALDAFVDGRVRALEMLHVWPPTAKGPPPSHAHSRSSAAGPKPASKPHITRVHTSQVTPSPPSTPTCSFCGSNHYIAACSQFRATPVEQRKELVTTRKLCCNCLGLHKIRDCRSQKRCITCKARHHTLLHESGPSSSPPPQPGSCNQPVTSLAAAHGNYTLAPAAGSASVHHAAAAHTVFGQQKGMLATALVKVVTPQGGELLSRVLLDQGAELSFVSEHVAQALQLPRLTSKIALTGIGALKPIQTRGAVRLTLQHRRNSNVEVTLEAHVLSKITGNVPAQPINGEQWSHLSGLELADPKFNAPGSIDILLGADIYGHLLLGELRKASPDAPVAQLTTFGWVISGPIISERWKTPRLAHHASSISDQDLYECVQKFWAQEIVPSKGRGRLSKAEEECETHFRTTHSRDPTGRYVVRLPFSASPSGYAESRIVAERMFERTQRRFRRDAEFQKLYADFMDEYRKLGHMKFSPNSSENSNESYYLSHHGVLRESSATSKLRVVFNGSQKIICGASLNETLHPGPKLQQDIVDVISRWRLYSYVFSSDVEKMYRQIQVHNDDRRFQTILWSDTLDAPPESYQLGTVTYGLACAPYLAIRVLH